MSLYLSKRNKNKPKPAVAGVAHLADRVIVTSDTSTRRQLSTLSTTGLLTCVHTAEIRNRGNNGQSVCEESINEKKSSEKCAYLHPRQGQCVFKSVLSILLWVSIQHNIIHLFGRERKEIRGMRLRYFELDKWED